MTTLWPPNHTSREVTLAGAIDVDNNALLEVAGVTQDEVVGDEPDARIVAITEKVRLRTERDGSGDGRVYRIAFTVSDTSGASCTGTVTVSVPTTGAARRRSTPVTSTTRSGADAGGRIRG